LKTTYIVWCPNLSFGGAEKHALELAKAAQGRADIEVWVDSDDIGWGKNYLNSFGCEVKLHAGIKAHGRRFLEASLERLGEGRLAFHIVNSSVGFDCIPLIAALPNAGYYISAFGDNVLPDGRKISAIRFLHEQYRRAAQHVFTDSLYYRDQLVQDGVVAADQVTVVTHPAAVGTVWQRSAPAGKLLWASRISDEKRLEDLFAMAVATPALAFHVYGGVDRACCTERGEALYRALQVLPNVKVMGKYRRFDDIALSEYDALVYTSERDGVPNVLLEAGSAGMPVISTVVGGIGELLNEGNSFSKPNAGVVDYIGFVSDLYQDFGAARHKGQLLRNEIEARSVRYPLDKVVDLVLGEMGTAATAPAVAAMRPSKIEAGHAPYFVQKMLVSSQLKGTHRNAVFSSLCDGRSVLHVGCADAPITDIRNNLHLAVQGTARVIDGFDLDTHALDMLRPHITNGRLFSNFAEIEDDYDLLMVPEVIEHVDNVEQFLQTLDKLNFSEIVITAPDAFTSMQRHFDYDVETSVFCEIVHPDDNAWYSPFTLANLVRKYTSWTVEGLFFLDPGSIMLVASKRAPE
jgi:glycosyltransferase involved in cell wall biosynthesis